jgi:hypothetical protein
MNNTIDENYNNLKAVIMALTQDYEKFKEKKIKAAGQRVRASLLNTKKLCDVMRRQVIDDIRAIPIKHRKSSDEEMDIVEEEKPEMDIVEEEKPEMDIVEEKPKIRKKYRQIKIKT